MNRRGLIVAGLAGALALSLAPSLAAAQEKATHKKGGGLSFIQLDTLTANVMRLDGRRGIITVEIGVDVPDGALHARAAQSTPLLRAAYAEVLRTYAAGLPPGAPPDPDYLSMALQRATDTTLGRPGAKLVLGTILDN
jgi:hypothetical protein